MKKILSVILAAVMLFALLPTAFASGEESEAIEFEFNPAAKNATANIEGNSNVIAAKDMAEGYEEWSVESMAWIYKSWIHASRNCIQAYALESVIPEKKGDESRCGNTFALAIVLDIGETGTYIPKLTYLQTYYSPVCNVYLVKKNDGDDTYSSVTQYNNETLESYISGNCNENTLLGSVDMYRADKKPDDGIEGADDLKAVNITDPGEYYLIIERAGLNPDFGNYTVQSTYYASYMFLKKFSLTLAETQEDIISSFALDGSRNATHSASVNTYAAALDGREISASVSATDTDGDGIYTVTAPATDTTGEYTFLYWIRGLTSDKANKIVSRTATIEEYKPQNGANYLIAVYEKKGAETEAKAEFYDGNGQLLYTTEEDDIDENNVAVADGVITLPALPRMARYTSATHWQLYGDATNTEYKAGETVTLSGRMIFVAQYDDVNVTVNGDEVRYGDSVTLTADADTEGRYFKWWTRTVGEETEIVSTDRTYTFCPWESCTVSAVYGDTKQIMAGNLRKIIIDVLGNNAIMAEFIGLDGAEVLEKGIKLGDKKIAMSTNASQFTITNNISAASASGYAIIKDGETVTEITDGTATLSE